MTTTRQCEEDVGNQLLEEGQIGTGHRSRWEDDCWREGGRRFRRDEMSMTNLFKRDRSGDGTAAAGKMRRRFRAND
ncbi:hypothetical protein ACLOJK_003866 [Asimina triloba]